jgi:sugar/nucleoside kinase (ribokinase family)
MCCSGLECVPLTYDVLVIGRPSCDLIFTDLSGWPNVGQELFAQGLTVSAGGAFNVVAALHRLGLRPGLVGIIGSDSWSQLCLNAIRAEGVPTDLLLMLDRPLPSVSVCMTHAGDRGFVTYEPSAKEVGDAFTVHALDVVARECAGYLLCCLTETLSANAATARAKGMRVLVDCGWNETWLASEQIRSLMPLADVVFANQPEASVITGEADPLLAMRRLGELAPFVVMKRGVAGSAAVVEGREYYAPTEPVDVVDATGAGDCFNAGFLYGWHHGLPVESCLRLGNICGGMSVAVPGGFAGAPCEAELLRRAKHCGISMLPANL